MAQETRVIFADLEEDLRLPSFRAECVHGVSELWMVLACVSINDVCMRGKSLLCIQDGRPACTAHMQHSIGNWARLRQSSNTPHHIVLLPLRSDWLCSMYYLPRSSPLPHHYLQPSSLIFTCPPLPTSSKNLILHVWDMLPSQ
jgi:hypothetical protein